MYALFNVLLLPCSVWLQVSHPPRTQLALWFCQHQQLALPTINLFRFSPLNSLSFTYLSPQNQLSLSLSPYVPLMAVIPLQTSLWDSVLEQTKIAQEKGSDPLTWAIHLSSYLNSAGVSTPSPDLANLLVSHICWANNVPIAWKFLEKALAFKIVPPLLVLALLSNRFLLFLFPFFKSFCFTVCVFQIFSVHWDACISVFLGYCVHFFCFSFM